MAKLDLPPNFDTLTPAQQRAHRLYAQRAARNAGKARFARPPGSGGKGDYRHTKDGKFSRGGAG